MRRHAWNCDLSTKPGTDILTNRQVRSCLVTRSCVNRIDPSYVSLYVHVYIINDSVWLLTNRHAHPRRLWIGAKYCFSICGCGEIQELQVKDFALEDVCVPPDVKPFLVPFRVATLPRSGTCAWTLPPNSLCWCSSVVFVQVSCQEIRVKWHVEVFSPYFFHGFFWWPTIGSGHISQLCQQ